MEPDAMRWFDVSGDMWAVTKDNDVQFFVTGEEAFAAIGESIERYASKAASLYLLGWSCDMDTPLRPASRHVGADLLSHLMFFSKAGGTSYAMLWRNVTLPGRATANAAKFINALGHAIEDSRTPVVGSHHQKLLILKAGEDKELQEKRSGVGVAYCGGMDLHPNRVGADAIHDVHCRIRGPATEQLDQVFWERKADHPKTKPWGRLPPTVIGTTSAGKAMVQVCRTYPAFQNPMVSSLLGELVLPDIHRLLDAINKPTPGDMRDGNTVRLPTFYPARRGVQQVWRALNKVISQAKRFIYVEDQYFLSTAIAGELANRLKTEAGLRIVLLLLNPSGMEHEQKWTRRGDAIDMLRMVDPRGKRWIVVERNPKYAGSFVHSKTWIVDDEVVITGSANLDRRGLTYQSECNVVVAGRYEAHPDVPSIGAITVAQDLRCRLFAKHLGGNPNSYLDADRSIPLFFGNLGTTKIQRFDPVGKVDTPLDSLVDAARSSLASSPALSKALEQLPGGPYEFFWNYIHDPDPEVQRPT